MPWDFDGLLQIFDGGQVVLLADVVEPLDQIGLDVDVHVLGALDQELLVDHVAQQILLAIFRREPESAPAGNSGSPARTSCCRPVDGLLIIGKRDDLVVHAGDDFFDDDALGLGDGRREEPENQALHNNSDRRQVGGYFRFS